MKTNSTTHIGIIAYENCTSSIVLGTLDILSFANAQWRNFNPSPPSNGQPLFHVEILTLTGKPVASFNQHPIFPHGAMDDKSDFDTIIIPGCLGDLEAIIQAQRDTIAWLRERHSRGTCINAVCNGNFLLAETGLLDGREATTHWSCAALFRERYPKVELKPEKILIDGGDIISAAGVTAYLNLCVYLVGKFSNSDLASRCSKVFLVDSGRHNQTPYEMFNCPQAHGDREILKVQKWLESRFNEPVSVLAMANIAGLERRTFMRRFKNATGDSPRVYLQRMRIDSAKRKLESTKETVAEITWNVGYRDASSFQRLFKTSTGLSPGAYRRKFSLFPNYDLSQ
ncbi:MAG: GlxA family transcriptional regulator [bacterium]